MNAYDRDTDRNTFLSPDEARDELASFWRTSSHKERRRWWDNATADERDILCDAIDAKAGWAAVDAVIATGLELAAAPTHVMRRAS